MLFHIKLSVTLEYTIDFLKYEIAIYPLHRRGISVRIYYIYNRVKEKIVDKRFTSKCDMTSGHCDAENDRKLIINMPTLAIKLNR